MKQGSAVENRPKESLPLGMMGSLLDLLEQPILVAERDGRVIIANLHAKQYLAARGVAAENQTNLFTHLLRVDPKVIVQQMESGENEVNLRVECPNGQAQARIQWLPEPDWLVVRLEPDPSSQEPSDGDSAMQRTVHDLLQEREITYRNLLAAYLRLQEVNRQKTMFLASAAHELKTPLAVIKGYYDLLLSGSLGKLTGKQQDIMQESKESCERLVRLVSMFLNYSALESGKLVMHLRENDLRDCLTEIETRWRDAFARKNVRLDAFYAPEIPKLAFDYQKVQQSVANLLDNALKHTPAGGTVTLRAEPHFWERRAAEEAPSAERRSRLNQQPNCVRVAVSDTGPGIAAEHHQEIFEDFVRVDRSSSGMGLGLAIAKRLIQAHRGKIWVDSEPRRGCTFTFLLPLDNA